MSGPQRLVWGCAVAAFAAGVGFLFWTEFIGQGIHIDEDAVRRAAEVGHRWRSPIWRHDDGSFAEW
jgi:galactonate dehydratase